jgi:D-3-phosphoglycerate dehydrogenase
MYKVHCINNIAKVGTDALGENFRLTDNVADAEAIMVRSANLHEMDFSNKLLAIAVRLLLLSSFPNKIYSC